MATHEGPVTVASYERAEEAASARAFLEEAGIPCATGTGLSIAVPRDAVGRAVEVLRERAAEAAAATADEALAEDEGDAACLSCGARIPEYLERCPACGFDLG